MKNDKIASFLEELKKEIAESERKIAVYRQHAAYEVAEAEAPFLAGLRTAYSLALEKLTL
jgi:hypothetical protein